MKCLTSFSLQCVIIAVKFGTLYIIFSWILYLCFYDPLLKRVMLVRSNIFLNSLLQACTYCPPGYECPDIDDSSTVVECSPGYYSSGGQISCTQCPAGYACPSIYSSFKIKCYAGSYALAGAVVSKLGIAAIISLLFLIWL